jgi:hypothetical protein
MRKLLCFFLMSFSCVYAQEKPWWEVMSPTAFEKIAHNPKTAPTLVGNLWWNDYDSKSVVRKNEIQMHHLVGKWVAYRVTTSDIFKDTNKIMMDAPFRDTIYFIKGGYYFARLYPGTVRMELKDNLITIPLFHYYCNWEPGMRFVDRSQIGFINRITENELVITWYRGLMENMKLKRLTSYDRRYYRRAAFVPDP